MNKEVQPDTRSSVFQIGNRVRVTNYSPFRGLEGTIRMVDGITDGMEETFCFYLVALQGATISEPVWFEQHEVECIGFPVFALQPLTEFTSFPVTGRDRDKSYLAEPSNAVQ